MVGQLKGATLLRTLTLKSLIKFGEFKDNTVADLIAMRKHEFLIKLYYNCSNINFNEEVLQLLKIKCRIPKPGKNLIGENIGVIANALQEIRDELTLQDEKMHRKERNYIRKRAKRRQAETEAVFLSKHHNKTLNRTRYYH